MKLNKNIVMGLCLALFVCLSCSKDDENGTLPKEDPHEGPTTPTVYDYNPLVSDRIQFLKSYSRNGNTIYQMGYDNQRRLTSVKGSEGYAFGFEIDYDKRSITEKRLQEDRLYRFTLNRQGYIDTMVCDYNLLDHTYREVLVYEYDGDYLKKASCEFTENGMWVNVGIDHYEATYQYEKGLLTTVKYGDVAWVFTYGETANPDRLSPVGFCPLMVFTDMPDKIRICANDLLYHTGLFGLVSDKLPDSLTLYTNYLYDNLEEYLKNKEMYRTYISEYAFTYTTDQKGVVSMSATMPTNPYMDLHYNFSFIYE